MGEMDIKEIYYVKKILREFQFKMVHQVWNS